MLKLISNKVVRAFYGFHLVHTLWMMGMVWRWVSYHNVSPNNKWIATFNCYTNFMFCHNEGLHYDMFNLIMHEGAGGEMPLFR